MAGTTGTETSGTFSLNSHDTALCIVPPKSAWSPVDRLRALYDKAYEKWPPHVNLVYPFVHPDVLPRAAEAVESAFKAESVAPLQISLDSNGVFQHKHEHTVYLQEKTHQDSPLIELRTRVLQALGHESGSFQMHMTVAQTTDVDSDAHKFLLHKVGLLPAIEWEADKLCILVRERLQVDGHATSQMKLWGTIDLTKASLSRLNSPSSIYTTKSAPATAETGEKDMLQTRPAYYFEPETGLWMPHTPEGLDPEGARESLSVSSYNVLAEFTWPPSKARYPLLVKNIFAQRAVSDVLVLQEVTDDFLSYILRDEQIRDTFDFVSHGPPEQTDIEPLPSMLNVVVLSKYPFEWEWVSFLRKHKGAVVARFQDIGFHDGDNFHPLVLADIHLSHGLNDGAVSAKKAELARIFNYLEENYAPNPWIIAGDTNISTSSYSIDAALSKKAISEQSTKYLRNLDELISERKLVDAWTFARFELGEASGEEADEDSGKDVFEGEQGATYDPLRNEVAAKIVGSGFNMRPQRYDRILIKGDSYLSISSFNQFGFLKANVADNTEPTFASDHWGVRCVVQLNEAAAERKSFKEVDMQVVPVKFKAATGALADLDGLKDSLASFGVFPTEDDNTRRQSAFNTLKSLIASCFENTFEPSTRKPALVIVPVGSYGLGTWTKSSDIDCLCIGPFSTQTFFAVVVKTLRKAEDRGVRVLRRVRASTGTMLELDVSGIKMDLQYCSATSVAEQWSAVLRTKPSDPIWTLSTQTLQKLKAARDLDYLRRSVPDLAKFRLAYRFVKTWAKSRGIYSAKFGYLGGIQVSVLLARVCKLLARDVSSRSASVADILKSFFHHYAAFDWQKDVAFDPFFHKGRLQYHRTTREPLAILGYHPPVLNTSSAASLPSTRTIAVEFQRADALLSSDKASWASLLCGANTMALGESLDHGAAEFLTAYKSYIRLDAQFWGVSLSSGSQFVGWLESRCVMLLVDINRRTPGLHARIWPARFVSVEDTDDGRRDYQGSYLIGLDKLDETLTREDLQLALGSLQTVLHRFEALIRGDEHYFDAKSCWMSSSVVKQSELGALRIDEREWGDYTPGEDESDDEDEEEEVQPIRGRGVGSDSDGERRTTARKKNQKKAAASTAAAPLLEPGRKFRTAADIMNRLRWDPELDSGDYIIGYEDRFIGAMERPLDTWKLEQTDDEFIPQHRILWFRQKSTDRIVWERRTRTDEIFGSGV